MIRIPALAVCLVAFFAVHAVSADTEFRLKNSAYIYNGENTSYWEETRTTITYLENLIQPYLVFTVSPGFILKAGAGFLIPFNQEDKVFAYYPYIQTRLESPEATLIMGSLDSGHDFPAPVLDPLSSMTPQVRVVSESQIPLSYETFPLGLSAHGVYEYGLQLLWRTAAGSGEIYINWQLPDTVLHRERFDIGLIHSWELLYGCFHYWHNGGHENPHPVSITENYTGAAGLKNQTFTALYLASYFLPDRDSNPGLNVFGHGLFGEYRLILFDFTVEFQGFVSGQLLNPDHRFVSVEGDPFYRAPAYAGINISRTWEIARDAALGIGFVNGLYLADPSRGWDGTGFRYDQKIRIDLDLGLTGSGRTN